MYNEQETKSLEITKSQIKFKFMTLLLDNLCYHVVFLAVASSGKADHFEDDDDDNDDDDDSSELVSEPFHLLGAADIVIIA